MYVCELAIMPTPLACLTDLTPPTFAGIQSLVVQDNGALSATWLAAADPTGPISYQVYLKKDTATGLFESENRLFATRELFAKIFVDADGEALVEGQTYFVGVRAVDGVGNEETNLVALSQISSGVISGNLLSFIKLNQSILQTIASNVEVVVETQTVEESVQAQEFEEEVKVDPDFKTC